MATASGVPKTSGTGTLVAPVGGASTTVRWDVADVSPKAVTFVEIPANAGHWNDLNVDGANGLQSFNVTSSFAAGERLGPNLVSVGTLTPVADPMSPTGAIASYRMTLTFSQPVNHNASVNHTGFGLTTVDVNGKTGILDATVVLPVAPTAPAVFVGATTITVSVTSATDVLQLSNAVTIGVQAGEVQNMNGEVNLLQRVIPS